MNLAKHTQGAQSLRRALQVLRVLQHNHERGLRMSDVSKLTGLEIATTHRLLACMVEEQFAEKNPSTKRYRLGIESMQLGVTAARRTPLLDTVRPTMKRLVSMSGDTVFLMIRNCDEVMCLHREEGRNRVKEFTISAGGRRLLGISAAGLTLLATLDDREIEDHVSRNRIMYDMHKMPRAKIWRCIQETRERGFTEVADTITHGVAGVSTLLPLAASNEIAMSIGTSTAMFSLEHRRQLADLLSKGLNLTVSAPNNAKP